MANRLDDQAVFSLAGNEGRSANPTLEDGLFAVEPQLAAMLGFAVALQPILDQHGSNLRLEERNLIRIVGITVAREHSKRAHKKQQPIRLRGTISWIAGAYSRRIRQDYRLAAEGLMSARHGRVGR